MSRRYGRVEMLAVTVCLMTASTHAQTFTDQARDEVRAAKHQALDADLKADWNGLLDARDQFAKLPATGDVGALRLYYLGYVDWRLSSLAYVGLGAKLVNPLVSRAVDELKQSAALQPASAETQGLLAMCAGLMIAFDRTRTEELRPVTQAAWQQALEVGKDNPRVQFLRAMVEVFAPPEFGGNRDGGLERWKHAIELFDKEATSAPAPEAPDWGRAESWAWLGGAYSNLDRREDAVPALERAVAIRPDFWWAARAALPQAKRQP